jgi:hypothetical protein
VVPKPPRTFGRPCIRLPYGDIRRKRPVPALHSNPVEHYANRLTLLLAAHLFRRKRFATRREPVGSGSTTCGRGGIGRRAALRSLWGNPWKFESSRPHQFYAPRAAPNPTRLPGDTGLLRQSCFPKSFDIPGAIVLSTKWRQHIREIRKAERSIEFAQASGHFPCFRKPPRKRMTCRHYTHRARVVRLVAQRFPRPCDGVIVVASSDLSEPGVELPGEQAWIQRA